MCIFLLQIQMVTDQSMNWDTSMLDYTQSMVKPKSPKKWI